MRDRSVKFMATGLGLGLLPGAPGTYGTLLGIPLAYFLAGQNMVLAGAFVFVFSVFAIFVASRAEALYGESDCQKIVIDEVAGYLVTMLFLPFTAGWALAGFVVFRVLDSWKPGPIRLIDDKCSGGFGVVADDLAAGVAGNLLLQLVFHFSKNIF